MEYVVLFGIFLEKTFRCSQLFHYCASVTSYNGSVALLGLCTVVRLEKKLSTKSLDKTNYVRFLPNFFATLNVI